MGCVRRQRVEKSAFKAACSVLRVVGSVQRDVVRCVVCDVRVSLRGVSGSTELAV